MHDERGSVTAETAVVLPALVLVLCAGLWALSAVAAQVRCVDVARSAARALARGEPLAQVRTRALSDLPGHSTVSLRREGDQVVVAVHTVVRPLGPLLGRVASVPVDGTVSAPVEGDQSGSAGR